MPKVIAKAAKVLYLAGMAVLLAPAAGSQQQSPASPAVSNRAQALYMQLGGVGLERTRVYKARDVSIDRAEIHISLDNGVIGFTSDVLGKVTGAFFEGDGEILLAPPDKAERASMALFTGAAILEEQFITAYFRFNDSTYEELKPQLTPAEHPDEFVSQWNQTARNLAEGDALRLMTTFSRYLPGVAGPVPAGVDASDRLLRARIQGRKLGIFDVYYDSSIPEDISAGQLRTGKGGTFYDVWTSFGPDQRSRRGKSNAPSPAWAVEITRYQIKTTITPPSQISAEAVLDLNTGKGGASCLLFELSRFLHVSQVSADGRPVEFVHNQALEGTQLARRGNDVIAVVFPEMLAAQRHMRLAFTYTGDVLSDAGGGLLYVGARGTWYPNRGLSMADFDLEFRYPAEWTLVATGSLVLGSAPQPGAGEEKSGEQVSHWKSDRPIPVAGFNVGRYTQAVASAGDVTVEAYAAKGVERSFPKGRTEVVVPALPQGRGEREHAIVVTAPPPAPARNAQTVAERSAEAIQFFSRNFGPYPYRHLSLAQMPGDLSQGWPELVFLSSFSFLNPEERANLHMSPVQVLLSEGVVAHETAHQWWGDLVNWGSYRDQWLAEALSNYSALMLLESHDESKFREVMEYYRTALLEKNSDGEHMRDAGPVTLGTRLSSSHFPNGYETISYGRGTWLLHMLRSMMREAGHEPADGRPATAGIPDEPFVRALRRLRELREGQAMTTADMLGVMEAELPARLAYDGRKSLQWFYDGWINGTAIPTLELQDVKFTRKGAQTIVSGKLVQKDAPDDLITVVPLYSGLAPHPVFLGQVIADGPETSFHMAVPNGTSKLLLDPYATILCRR